MEIYKNSDGNYVCKNCGNTFIQMNDALECAGKHTPVPPPVVVDERNLGPQQLVIPSVMRGYADDAKNAGMQTAAERLMLSLIEDYVILRDKDMREKGNIGPMAFNAGKAAAEAVNNYNKQVYGTKSSSINVNVDAKKKSDLDAMKDILVINGKEESNGQQ
jgi:hypothetical protein